MRFLHPKDAALKVDLNEANQVREYIENGQMRWDLDGVVELRGERTFFECSAIRIRNTLSVLYANSPLWWTPPPS